MIEERLIEHASLYALGALEGAEAREFETALQDNAELRQLVSDLASVSLALAGTVPVIEPSADLRGRVLGAASSAEGKIVPLPARAKWISWAPWALAAGLALICGVLQQDNARKTEDAKQVAVTYQAQIHDLNKLVQDLRETNLLTNVRIAVLSSLMTNLPKSVAVTVWDSEKQSGEFVCLGLLPPASDKDYQLWIIDGGTPVDAGVFKVGPDGNVRVSFTTRQRVKDATIFAVTEETKGGNPTPAGTMVLKGS